MSETPQYEIGQVENGHRWTGASWEPVTAPAEAPAAPPAPPVAPGSGFADDPAAYWAPAAPGVGPVGAGSSVSPARVAAPLFFAGVVVAVGVSIAGIVVVNSSGGGILWWGGYFVAFALWRSAKAKYDAAARGTGVSMSGAAKAVVALGLVIGIGSAAVFGLSWANASSTPALTETVGSCWQQQGDKGVLVDCGSSDAEYQAVAVTATEDACPQEAIASIKSDSTGQYLCLAKK